MTYVLIMSNVLLVVSNAIWWALCTKINNEWHERCTQQNDNWIKLCQKQTMEWSSLMDKQRAVFVESAMRRRMDRGN